MNGMTSFITAVCVSCVFIGVLQLVCPDGAMEKSVKYIISLVFLVTVMAAGFGLSGGFDGEIDFKEHQSISAEEIRAKITEQIYRRALTNAGINFSKITVCTTKAQNGSIIINKVIIYSDCEKMQILNALGLSNENTEVEIINE